MSGTIIIVSRNNLHLTKRAVISAKAQDMPVDVLVIDNASTDGTQQWVTSQRLRGFFYTEQVSLSKCWNDALKAVWKYSDHALVLNNDVEIRPDTYRLLLEHGGPFVTCVSVDSSERMGTVGDRRNAPKPIGIPECVMEDYSKYEYLGITRNIVLPPVMTERPSPDFSAFMIRKEVTDNVGWFNEELFPAHYEDNFFHVRLHRAGIRAVCIDLPFLHHGAQTIKNSDPAERRKIQRGAERNKELFRAAFGCVPGTKEYEALFWQQDLEVPNAALDILSGERPTP